MAACPDCGRESARVHSRYSRTLSDVAAGDRPVLITLTVRRLFCDGPPDEALSGGSPEGIAALSLPS
ncbi:transposase family protein [Streptomyces sp. NPDC002559]